MKNRITNILWDTWCVGSIIGIWPRFIEPKIIKVTKLELPIKGLPPSFDGFRIVQFSDLHLHTGTSSLLLDKLIRKIQAQKPDIIVFTGDFICNSKLVDPDRLKLLLNSLRAPYGCFAILGNHDYEQYVSINDLGEYDIVPPDLRPPLQKGFHRLLKSRAPTGIFTSKTKGIKQHQALHKLLQETPFQILENKTIQISFRGSTLNLCGLGDYICGRFDPSKAFKSYHAKYPGVVLTHNPDSVPHLTGYPGEVILCGHTHGAEVNLPWMWKKFMLMEDTRRKSGLLREQDRWIYVNRGIGGAVTFRWFASPEILSLTLKVKNHE